MSFSKNHYLNLSNGQFDGTTKEDLDNLFESYRQSGKNVMTIHFHGGLVSEKKGMEIAERLYGEYDEKAGAYPVFFVWQSGPFESVFNNLNEIMNEKFFQRLLRHLLRFSIGKLRQTDRQRGFRLDLPDLSEIESMLQEADKVEPLVEYSVSALPQNETLRLMEEEQFKEELESDYVLMDELKSIGQALRTSDEIEEDRTKSRGVRVKASTKSLMSPSILEEIRQNAPAPSERGIFTVGFIIKKAVKILKRIIERYANRRDHGVYITIVEEILRELYIDNVGSELWNLMKNDTADSFKKDDCNGGFAFVEGLKYLKEQNQAPDKIVLIGHSTGAVYISNMLKCVDRENLPEDIKFDIVFLAPACTFELFAEIIENHKDRIENIRLFGMQDPVEKSDKMVPVIYPHSLLYFVSGLLEGEVDKPLVGMQRFYTGLPPFDSQSFPEIMKTKEFFKKFQDSMIWSVTDRGPGKASNSKKHGDFDNDEATLVSLVHIIKHGF